MDPDTGATGSLLHTIYEALEGGRQEIREMQKKGAVTDTDVAVLKEKIKTIERQTETLWQLLHDLKDHEAKKATKTAEERGADNARWGFLGVIGGSLLAWLVSKLPEIMK